MCCRFALINDEAIQKMFAGTALAGWKSRYNLAPGFFIPVLLSHNNQRQAASMRWGLVPRWARDTKIGYKMINAPAEGLEDKLSFKESYRSKRCLIPASGFYEWQNTDGAIQPCYIQHRDGSPLLFAGLYDNWKDKQGKDLPTCTIITTTANISLAPLHDRMPVILDAKAQQTWLNTDLKDPTLLQGLLKTSPDGDLDVRPVSSNINFVQKEDATLIRPISRQ